MKYDTQFRIEVANYINKQIAEYDLKDFVSLFEVVYEFEEFESQYVVFKLQYGNTFIKVKRACRHWKTWLDTEVYQLKPTIIMLFDKAIDSANQLKSCLEES